MNLNIALENIEKNYYNYIVAKPKSRRMTMKKFLLFAFAISLGSVAFAAWPPPPLPQGTCDFFGYPSWHNRSVKGCLTCPVYENGHKVTCESVSAANGGVINKDCCWLNTPKNETTSGGYNNLDPILGNCYTNGCVLGPNPWSVKCVCLLNCQMNPSPDCELGCDNLPHPSPNPDNNPKCLTVNQNNGNSNTGAPNGGNGGNGNGGNGNGHKIPRKITGQKPPTGPVSPFKSASGKKEKQPNSEKNTK